MALAVEHLGMLVNGTKDPARVCKADSKICSAVSNSEVDEPTLVSNRQSAPFVVATPIFSAPSNLAEIDGPHNACNFNSPNSVP